MVKPSFDILFWSVATIFMVVLFGSMGLVLWNDQVQFNERTEFCINEAYEKATRADKRIIDGQYYAECYDEEIINDQLVETEDWVRWNP